MRRAIRVSLRGCVALAAFLAVTIVAFEAGTWLTFWVADWFPPHIGSPSTDPHGRATTGAIDTGLGIFICPLLGVIGGWLAWLWTDRKNWSFDLFVTSPLFVAFAIISAANYISYDTLFTRDAQAVLNLILFAAGATVVVLLQSNLSKSISLFIYILGAGVLAFTIYAFVAIPIWYSISFVSWKLGAGELNSLDSAAKAISAAASLIAVIGIIWKDGRLTTSAKLPGAPREK
jgi:hypothetical protein